MFERRMFEAARKAHWQIGASIACYLETGTAAWEVLAILKLAGAPHADGRCLNYPGKHRCLIQGGSAAAGIGSNVIKENLFAASRYAATTARTDEVPSWIREARGGGA